MSLPPLVRQLIDACKYRGKTGLAAQAIAEGAEVDHPDQDGHSALFFAVANRNVALVELLLESGAKLTVRNVVAPALHHLRGTMVLEHRGRVRHVGGAHRCGDVGGGRRAGMELKGHIKTDGA